MTANAQHLDADVLIVGAGPAGSVAAKCLHDRGHRVLVLERDRFPRFSIGESLLPQCMTFLEQAGMANAVREHGFQHKDGAVFFRAGKTETFSFLDKFTAGPETTFQVQRATFDNLLAQTAINAGVDIRFEEVIHGMHSHADHVELQVKRKDGTDLSYRGQFVLDASGFGRVLPRLLKLERPSAFPVRQSLFTHVADGITSPLFDRNKIRVTVHPQHRDVWFWLIPFSNGRASVGVVGEQAFFADRSPDRKVLLTTLLNEDPALREILANAQFDTPVNTLVGYAADVSSLHGDRFALLGNAGEFLDPIFSSGVTIAMKSAMLATAVLDRQLQGQPVDWAKDYAIPLQQGVNVFRDYVNAWYDGTFQDIIFSQKQTARIRQMICSILAGYVWDTSNPFVEHSKRRLSALAETVREMG